MPGNPSSGRRRRLAVAGPLAAGIAVGLAAGLGAYTFVYARGASYLGHDSKACANCHVMEDQYAGWLKSSHRAVAQCNDCHTPPGLLPKYWTKASNGFRHSFAFTTGRFPDTIRITAHDRGVTERACRHCHADVVQAIDRFPGHGGAISCVRCHLSVGHLH